MCCKLYIRVQHIFLFFYLLYKNSIQRAFYIPRSEDFKTVFLFFFSDMNISRIFWLGSPEVNIVVWSIKRYVLEHWTQISNQFLESSKNVRLTGDKPCFLENYFAPFLLPVHSSFMITKKWFDISVQGINVLLLIRHKGI